MESRHEEIGIYGTQKEWEHDTQSLNTHTVYRYLENISNPGFWTAKQPQLQNLVEISVWRC